MLPLLELIRCTGWEPLTKKYEEPRFNGRNREKTSSSVFTIWRYDTGNAEFVLGKALSLARWARSRKWSAEELAKRFTGFTKTQRRKKSRVDQILIERKAL